MRMCNIVICLLVLSVVVISACTTRRERPQETTVQLISEFDVPIQLQIKISSDKSNVSISDSIVFDLNIRNLPTCEAGSEEISVFNPVKLGVAGGLTIIVESHEGSEIFPKEGTAEQHVQPIIDESWPYFVLESNQYVGVSYKDSIQNIFRKPGKYLVFAEYLSPVTEADIKKHGNPRSFWGCGNPRSFWGCGNPRNFWGRELGPIRSVPLEIVVTE